MRFTAKHYAEALRASVSDIETYRKTIADLTNVAEHLAADSTVRAFFTNRTTPVARLEKVLHDAFQNSTGRQVYALLRVLIGNRQVHLLASVIRYAEHRADGEDGTSRVHIASAGPIAARMRDHLEDALAKRTGRRIIATYEEQPSIIGGIRITIDGTTQWDASVAGRFNRLRERIREIV